METGYEDVPIEEGRRFTVRRVIAMAAIAAGAGVAVWAVLRVRRIPALRERASELTAAARRLQAHPERLARGNERPILRKILEVAAATMAKTLAVKLTVTLLRAAVIDPSEAGGTDAIPKRGFAPLPA